MPKHLDIALSYVGLKEIKGLTHNPTIVGWLHQFARNVKTRFIKMRGDEIAWCAVFVSHCLAAAGMQETGSALAASYVTYGKPSKLIPGAVIVIRRKKRGPDKSTGSRAGNHTGFLLRATKDRLYIVGGNQGNRVSKRWFSLKQYELIACRAPVARVRGTGA